ncbi:TLC domain-containing protein At5g14285-like [Apium graveolens]|uniref:TLC domain-containing protein At5g14285-like n=1 Tax=Apium graveolens TaxID=4045 RepID=UPI003D78D8E4
MQHKHGILHFPFLVLSPLVISPITYSRDLLVFFSFYLTIYLLAHFLIFNNWTSKLRPEAASCLISYFHGSPAVFLAGKALLSDQNRGFASTNTTFQTLVLDYSIAYFLMDLIHYLLFYPSDILFIAHHLATLFVFMTCRFVVFHGAYAVLVLLIIAEVTSFCQNTWTLACARRKDSEFADKVILCEPCRFEPCRFVLANSLTVKACRAGPVTGRLRLSDC